jgi:hypothetical protein
MRILIIRKLRSIRGINARVTIASPTNIISEGFPTMRNHVAPRTVTNVTLNDWNASVDRWTCGYCDMTPARAGSAAPAIDNNVTFLDVIFIYRLTPS